MELFHWLFTPLHLSPYSSMSLLYAKPIMVVKVNIISIVHMNFDFFIAGTMHCATTFALQIPLTGMEDFISQLSFYEYSFN